jgi:hypothetical protein
MLPWISSRKIRHDYLAAHVGATQTDEEFIRDSGADAATSSIREIALTLREVLAQHAGIPKEYVCSNQPVEQLEPLMGSSGVLEYLFGGAPGFDADALFVTMMCTARENGIKMEKTSPKAWFTIASRQWRNTELGTRRTVGEWVARVATWTSSPPKEMALDQPGSV